MRSFRSRSSRVALVALVLAIGAGLFAMHMLSIAPSSSPHAAHSAMAVDDTMPGRAATKADADAPLTHGHGLLTCVWILIGGLVLAIAAGWSIRIHRGRETPRQLLRYAISSAQRAPPSSVRLSLVGTARC